MKINMSVSWDFNKQITFEMQEKETVCFNIKTSWHIIARMYNAEGASFGLSASTGYVLLNIHEEAGSTATQIASLIGMEATSMTRMLRTLKEKNLIYKKQDQSDKRMYKIFLTEEGKKKREISKKAVKTFNKKVREQVSQEKLKIFFEVIEKINKIAETNHND